MRSGTRIQDDAVDNTFEAKCDGIHGGRSQ
jgi:hypothetical protein